MTHRKNGQRRDPRACPGGCRAAAVIGVKESKAPLRCSHAPAAGAQIPRGTHGRRRGAAQAKGKRLFDLQASPCVRSRRVVREPRQPPVSGAGCSTVTWAREGGLEQSLGAETLIWGGRTLRSLSSPAVGVPKDEGLLPSGTHKAPCDRLPPSQCDAPREEASSVSRDRPLPPLQTLGPRPLTAGAGPTHIRSEASAWMWFTFPGDTIVSYAGRASAGRKHRGCLRASRGLRSVN